MNYDRYEVKTLLRRGVDACAFPGAVAFWGDPSAPPSRAWAGSRGRSRNAEPVTPELLYDLASVTKVVCATSLALIMAQRGLLVLDRPLTQSPLANLAALGSSKIPWTRITPAHLLAHQSGLRPWRPLYRLAGGDRASRRQAALTAIWGEKPQAGPGQRTIYSDLNFILLGFLLEEIGGAPLEELFQREVAKPLGLAAMGGYRPRLGPLAPTEDGFRYGGPVGHPEAAILGPTPLGQPHDDNARWLGGAAGHAGLFAPAGAVWAVAADWARAWSSGRGKIFERSALAEFIHRRPAAEDPGRPLGFNHRSGVESLAGSRLSPTAVGHLGYTGPALWWDYERNFIWLFLTNRVHPRVVNPAWRPGEYQGGPV